MNKLLFIILVILLSIFVISYFPKTTTFKQKILAVGTGNSGDIYIYNIQNDTPKELKRLETRYKFAHTVRVGDIYNNGKNYIVAGVSNSFFAEPYGCKVVSYDLSSYKESLIDDVGDLRCKDLAIGDVDNDGKNEIILGTHGQGIVRTYKWTGDNWSKEDIEKNYIAQIDDKENTNHRVPQSDLTCAGCTVQTAVHIVKVGDVYNNGQNALVVTMSSPLELQKMEEVSFVRVYQKVNGKWQSETIDRLAGREFRSITIGDVYNTGKNVLLIGIGSPRKEPGSLYAYEYKDQKWQKTVVYDDSEEQNMKGVAIGDIYGNGKNRILLATGFPNAKILILSWDGKEFQKNEVARISSLFSDKDAQYNSMAAFINRTVNGPQLFIGGMITFPKKNIGWEGTDKGFLVTYTGNKTDSWTPKIIEERNVLGIDIP